MDDYLQPDFYRFSEDSVRLARFASGILKQSGGKKLKGADICAGCGVVGLELMCSLSDTSLSLLFVETQELFMESLGANIERHLASHKMHDAVFVHDSFQNIVHSGEFDFIVCNPPYFKKGSGRLPESVEKEICRFRDEGFLEALFEFCEQKLCPGGSLFLSFPTRMTKELELFSRKGFEAGFSEDLSGVSILLFTKLKEN